MVTVNKDSGEAKHLGKVAEASRAGGLPREVPSTHPQGDLQYLKIKASALMVLLAPINSNGLVALINSKGLVALISGKGWVVLISSKGLVVPTNNKDLVSQTNKDLVAQTIRAMEHKMNKVMVHRIKGMVLMINMAMVTLHSRGQITSSNSKGILVPTVNSMVDQTKISKGLVHQIRSDLEDQINNVLRV